MCLEEGKGSYPERKARSCSVHCKLLRAIPSTVTLACVVWACADDSVAGRRRFTNSSPSVELKLNEFAMGSWNRSTTP